MNFLYLFIFLFSTSNCWASNTLQLETNCAGINQQLPDKNVSKEIISALIRQVPEKEKQLDQPFVIKKIDKYMGKDNWHVVWATPEKNERGIFVLKGTPQNFEYVLVWGGVATDDEEQEIFEWFKKTLPEAPITLLKCVAYTITHGND